MEEIEINTIIAARCGHRYHKPTEEEIKSGSYYQYEPKFYRDLNLMRYAERSLSPSELRRYINILCDEFRDGTTLDHDIESLIMLDAPQKAEAYVRAIGKWR